MVCQKCTRTQAFAGVDRIAAVRESIKHGWVVRNDSAICKRCPAYREKADKPKRIDAIGIPITSAIGKATIETTQ